jgi:exonuclease SbcC
VKLLHSADLHAKPETADQALQSLAVMLKTARTQGVDLIILAGDIWDCVIRNTAGSRFPELVEAIRALADVAPLVMIYGTPTHDADGSLDVFATLTSRFGITILEPGKAYFLKGDGCIETKDRIGDPAKAILFGVPEPSKKWLAPYFDSKDQAEQAVRDGLRGLFTALGAIRRQYSALPCVLVYHGQVGGARLQNGDLLDNGSGIRPSFDDLAAVGADYIAMGDIHLPQRVGESRGLPAYYPGSAFPANFGETHEAAANLVTLTRTGDSTHDHTVTRVSFGHPVNQTIRARLVPTLLGPSDIDKDLKAEVAPGRRVKLEVTLTKEDQALFSTSDLEARLTAAGAAPGSQVVLNVLPTETVRAGDIATKTRLRDKVTIWGQNSKKAIPESLLTKADQIEAEATAAGVVGRGARISLTKLILRGAIGLKKKSGLDEIGLDLEAIDEGLVALIGSNGAGKTTLLENMHPWPELLTRGGTLKSHFFLRDSFRDLYWTDELTGEKYRALITINAATASGATEYFLYVQTGDGWTPLPGIEGRKEGYVEAVNRIFGSKDLYLRSAFVTQRQPKDLPDLADATPGQRKALFSALCGTDYLEAFKLLAKAQADQLETQGAAKQTEIDVLTARLPDRAELEATTIDAQAQVEDARGNLCILAELGKDKAKVAEALGVQVAGNKQVIDQANEAARVAQDAERRAGDAENLVLQLRRAIDGKAAAEKTIAEHTEMSAALAVEDEAYRKHLEAVAEHQKVVDAARAEYDRQRQAHDGVQQAKLTAHQDQLKALGRSVDEALRIYSGARDTETRLRNRVENLEGQLSTPVAETCPTCGQSLPADALETVRANRAKLQADLDEAKTLLASATSTVKDFELQYSTAKRERDSLRAPEVEPFPAFVPPPSTITAWNDGKRRGLRADLDFLGIDKARADLATAEKAAVRIEELTKQLVDLAATSSRERQRESELRAQIRPSLEAELSRAQLSLEETRSAYREAQGIEVRAIAEADMATLRIKGMDKELMEIDGLKQALAKFQAEVAEWRLLELSCSDKGIQALELDAVAPSIGAIANGLLREAFGSRYQVEFSTTRMGGKGAAQTQIETFQIMILDTETGESQEIATLSGGEAVWIRRALYDAFGLIRARSTNLVFLTTFQDETDGQLDPEARLTYLRMVASAHRQAGRRHTIMITHSVELQELIPARIVVAKLKPRPTKESVAA